MNQDNYILAVKMGTLPKFIQKNGKESIDILEYIKNTKDNLKKILKNVNIVEPEEVALLYLGFNDNYQKNLEFISKQDMDKVSFVEQTLNTANIDTRKVNLEKSLKYRSKIEKQISQLKQENKELKKYKIKVGPIVKEAIQIVATYDTQNLDSVFNQICLKNDIIPFAVYEREKVFFKIYKEFSPEGLETVDENWYNSLLLWFEFVNETGNYPIFYRFYDKRIFSSIEQFEKEQYLYKWMTTQQKLYSESSLDFLKLYMLIDFEFPFEKRKVKPKIILKYQNNQDIILNINKEGRLSIKFNSIDNKNRDTILKEISNLFETIKLPNPEIKENIITSSVQINLDTFYNKYILLDLISNNLDFTQYLFVNEFEKVSKSKENTIWVYFKDEFKDITISITRSKYDSNIVFLKIKKTSESKIKNIVRVMENLFKIYSQKKDSIIKFYKKYITTFTDSTKVKKIKEKKGVKILDTELFPKSFYARNCQGKSQPQIDKGEVTDENRKFKYPLGIKDKEPKKYVCVNDLKPWPGLKELQKLPDKKKHLTKGWVPCCYKSKGKPYRNMRKYIENNGNIESLLNDKKTIKQTSIEETNHFITDGQTKKFNFKLLGDGKFFRKGFAKNKSKSNINSFMYCMYYIFRNDYPEIIPLYEKKDYKNLDKFFSNKRKEFSKDLGVVSLCKQELYDRKQDEIIKIIDSGEYFDPKLFVNILSSLFSCNIFLFEKREKKVELVLPRHKDGYYHELNYGLCVLLYLNSGSISSKNKFPQCEIIGVLNESRELETLFDSESESVSNVNIYNTTVKIFNIMTNNIVLNKFNDMFGQNFRVPQVYFKNQYFDAYGKTRIITFEYQKNKGTLITSPIQPIELIKSNDSEIFKIESSIATNFFKNVLEIPYKFVIKNKESIAVTGYLGNITCIIPIISSKKITGLDPIKMDFMIPDKSSYMKNFNIKRRLAFCLQSYVLWIYSRNRQKLDFAEFDLVNDLKKFEENYFVIKKDFLIDITSNKLNLTSPLLQKGKIIVDSSETRKRLIYYLFVNITNNANYVKNYHTNRYIPYFYQNIEDFSKYQTEIILEGIISFRNWYNNNDSLVYYNSVEPEKQDIYILQNSNIDNSVYIAINTDSWENALSIGDFWNTNGYVPEESEIEENDEIKPFNLYLYESKNNIEEVNINGGDSNVKICGYKVNDVPKYTSLLKI